MFKAKTKMVEPTSEAAASEVFVVADNIIPVRVASVDAILNTEFTEEMQVVPEKQVQQLIVENKTTNPLSKFFVRMSGYLDSMENFLTEMHSNYTNAIEQKKSIYQTEETDQDQRTSRAKRTARKLSAERKSNLPKPFGDIGSDILGLTVLNSLGGYVDEAMKMDIVGEMQIVPYTPVAGQLVAKGKTDPTQGEKGYVSGYPLTSLYGWRWGRMHGGVDIGVPIGTKFALKDDAVIKFVGWQNPNDPLEGYGLLVDAWVPSLKKMFRFGHLSSVAVKEGETIKAGSVLGASGNTGRSTGPHFHIEVHSQVTSAYGGDDPMPYIDYVIAGEDVQQRSEGSIERVGRVMVGEAGPEFVIPMSQMPIFAQLMMEEKIKSLNPYYISDRGVINDIGFERQSGFTNTMMAAGGITINNNHRIAAKRLTSYFPTAEPIHIAAAMGNFQTEAPGLKPNTYQMGNGPGRGIAQWEIIHPGNPTGRWNTAEEKYGPNVINSLEDQLKFVKWEMDTGHQIPDGEGGTRPNLPYGNAAKRVWLGTENIEKATEEFMEGYESPSVPHWTQRLANARFFLKQMPNMLGKSKTPPVPPEIVGPGIVGSEVGPKKVGTGIPFFPDLTIINAIKGLFQGNRSKTKKPRTPPVMSPEEERNQRLRNSMDASEFFGTREYRLDQIPGRVDLQSSNRLNSIPGNEQMQIASETQNQFSFDNAKGQIVALYKPTVYYTEA